MIPRAVLLFKDPKGFWDKLASEQGGIGPLMPTVLFFAAVAALSFGLGRLFWALRVWGFSVGAILGALIGMAIQAAAYAAVWVGMSLIAKFLADTFKSPGAKDMANTTKVALGAVMPMWIGAVLQLTTVGILGTIGSLGGLGYGVYMFYLGSKKLLGTPDDSAVGYTAVVMVLTFIAAAVFTIPAGCVVACLVVP
jgi:hypothetical protein